MSYIIVTRKDYVKQQIRMERGFRRAMERGHDEPTCMKMEAPAPITPEEWAEAEKELGHD